MRPAKFWYVDRDPNSPQQFQDELDAAIATLSDFPLAGRPYIAGTRRLALRSVPYALIYRVESSEVRISRSPMRSNVRVIGRTANSVPGDVPLSVAGPEQAFHAFVLAENEVGG